MIQVKWMAQRSGNVVSTPAAVGGNASMFRNILLVIDNSEGAHRCAGRCVDLARALSSRLQVVFVMSPLPAVARLADFIGPDACQRRAITHAQDALEHVAAIATAQGVAVTTRYIIDTRHAVAIVDAADHGGCDLVVLYGHPQDSRSLRHVARNVVLDGDTPVMVFP